MKKIIEIVKSHAINIDFFSLEGELLKGNNEIVDYMLRHIYAKSKDGKMVLTLMSERAYERAKRLLEEESNRIGIDYSI